MNNSGRNSRSFAVVAIIIALVVLGTIGYWGATQYAAHQRATARVSLAAGYATQPLGTPFTLESRIWQPNSGTFASSGQWVYTYSTNLPVPNATATAKMQLGRGAYQVVEGQPDVIGTNSATLYRDLITEDVALKVQIDPSADGSTSATTVTVTLTPLAGG